MGTASKSRLSDRKGALMARNLCFRLAVVVFSLGLATSHIHSQVSVGYGKADSLVYRQVGRIPALIDGQSFSAFAFDPVDRRLYAGSRNGVFWVDLNDKELRVKGPLLRKPIGTIEVAPEAGKLFYTTIDELGYINLRTSEPARILGGPQWRTARLAYEPTRKEMYIATHERGIVAYDTMNGERAATLEQPGWFANMLEAVPGKVFFSVEDKSGLFTIDAATHAIAPWPVSGKFTTPAYLDADPAGKYLFAWYDRFLVAIDIPTATVVGRRATAMGARIAFDPAQRLLIVSEFDQIGRPLIKIRAFSVDAKGLTQVAEIKNPSDGLMGLESIGGGFLQQTRYDLLLWSATPSPRAGQ
jgi:hypothetical protein